MGRHEVQVASVPVKLLPVTKPVSFLTMSHCCPYYIPSLKDVLERLRSCCGFVI